MKEANTANLPETNGTERILARTLARELSDEMRAEINKQDYEITTWESTEITGEDER